ncbi:MAG TPA: hypothetical protein PK948_11915 [Gemmatimonadales bacterium]|nr:hypothetical protein [Gemmatimonadales bacterium]
MIRFSRSFRSLLAVGLVAGVLGACDSTEPTKKPVGEVTTIAGYRAEDISPDGSTVLMTDLSSPTAEFAFFDVADGTTANKAAAGDALFDFATGISNTLRVSAIHGKPENAGLWSEATGWEDLGNIYPTGCEYDDVTHDQDQSSAWDISADGHTAVGLVWNGCNPEAYLWSDVGGVGGFTALDLLGAGPMGTGQPAQNRATVVSDDGTRAGGFASKVANVGGTDYFIDRWPAIWNSNGSGFMLDGGSVFTEDAPGEVLAISANGTTAAGIWNQKAFMWTSAGGAVNLSGDGFGWGQAVALNGQLVFGTNQAGFFDPAVPFVWTQAGGVQSLFDIAAANGIEIPAGWSWVNIAGASEDGTVVVGNAYDDTFMPQTVVLKMPVSVYGL